MNLGFKLESDFWKSSGMWRGRDGDLPVDGSLPERIVQAIEDVQEHGTDIARGIPIGWDEVSGGGVSTGVLLLPRVSTAPDDHSYSKEEDQADFATDRATDLAIIESVTEDQSTEDLGEVVQAGVECLGTSIEVSSVDGILLVGVEPVGRPEHGEEKNDIGLKLQGLPKTNKFGLP